MNSMQTPRLSGHSSRSLHTLHSGLDAHVRRRSRVRLHATPVIKDVVVQPPAVRQQQQSQQERKPAARGPSDLNDPAKIGATGHATVNVPLYPGPISLESYMTLPVEQYNLLDPKQIKHLEGNRFLLIVPRINILSVWIEPEVEMVVTTPTAASGTPRVVLQAENCRIRGSEMIEGLRLDQRFCMRFTTELTWDDRAAKQQQQQGSSITPGNGSSPFPVLALESSGWSSASWDDGQEVAPLGTGSITGNSKLEVWCEVIPPFHLMPREMLQASCNAVMRTLVNTLLPLFLRNLGADWAKWAQDPQYRAERANRSKPTA